MPDLFRKRTVDMTKLRTTSKMSLKLSCLAACGNDIREAHELYGFISDGMELPDFDPVEPSAFERIRNGADEVFGWIQSHGEDIMKGYQIIRSLKGGGAAQTASSIPAAPPIPDA